MRQSRSFVQITNFGEIYFCSDCLLNLQHSTVVTGSSWKVKDERVRLIKERNLRWCIHSWANFFLWYRLYVGDL